MNKHGYHLTLPHDFSQQKWTNIQLMESVNSEKTLLKSQLISEVSRISQFTVFGQNRSHDIPLGVALPTVERGFRTSE